MYDILADFDFDYCHGILYRLRVLALVFFPSYVYSPAFMPVFSSLCICFLRRMFIPRH